ncbi:MAG: hypothetical protein PHH60_00615 [Candidatus Margulisbacteria bacterium]|nr:hypothetical protein [Candidatus Margulisiibacteriota bacterium]
MRKLLVSLLLVVSVATFVSAELLVTANPLGQGKWGFELAAMQDQTFMDVSGATLMTYGGYVGYGLMENLDAYLQLGTGSSSGLKWGVTAMDYTLTAYGLNLKYTVLTEGASVPVSVAIGVGYKSLSGKFSMGGGSQDATGSQMGIAAGVSKVLAPFIPYGALSYKSDTMSAGGTSMDATQIDLTVGTAIAWSTQGAVMLEYTSQQVTPKAAGSSNYTSAQIAAGVSYALQ